MNAATPKRQPATEEISGQIERVTFHNEEKSFCVLRVKTPGRGEETNGVLKCSFTMSVVPNPADQDALWRLKYRQRRYLEHVTVDELHERLEHILRNAYFVARDGRLLNKGDSTKWVLLLTHILEEATLRKLQLRRPKLPSPYAKAPRAAELWDPLNLQSGTYLLKFGNADHMTSLYEKGVIQISPATTYMDDKFNSAIRDNERQFTQESLGATVRFPPGRDYSIPHEHWVSVPVIGTLKHTITYESDCYMACFSMRYEFRLFDDFGYDACLVIRDPQRFIEKMKVCSEAVLPGWGFVAAPVTYRDPFFPSPNQDVLFSKHFQFSYEKEFRLVWEPPTKQGALVPVRFEIGALTDYCDLLIL